MKIANPFDKPPNPEKQIQEARSWERDQLITDSFLNNDNHDEALVMERQNQYAELRRWQQNLQPKMQTLFEKLSGMYVSSAGTFVQVPNITPLTSFNGAYQLINYIETLDVNVIMSNYSEMRINMALRYGVGYPLIQFIKDNYRMLGIKKNYGQLKYIVNLIINTVEPTYLRALNAGERNLDGKIYKINRIENDGKKEEKKGIFK